MIMLILILFLLSETQNYVILSPLYQQKTTKNYHNFLSKNLKDQLIGMNIKEKLRMKIEQMNIDTFSIFSFVLGYSRWQC